jgi:signal transduction histidine kinase
MLDAFPEEAALLDRRASIVAVNSAWRRSADGNGLGDAQHGVGRSYLEACKAPTTAGSGGAAVGRAIRSLLRGRGDSFRMDYARPSPARTRWFEVRLTPLHAEGRPWILVVHTDITHRKQPGKRPRLDAKLQQQRDEEQRRLARELHDTTGQDMAAALLLIGRATSRLPASSGARPLLDEARELCRKILGDVRTLSYELRPPILDSAGLPEALRWYAQVFSRRSGIQLEVQAPRELQRCCPQTELALFRVAQEALSNVQRHSRAGAAAITLTRTGEALELEVRDRGGIAAKRRGPGALLAGQGTQSMKDRIRACGGTLAVESDERGTLVRATAPLIAEGTS